MERKPATKIDETPNSKSGEIDPASESQRGILKHIPVSQISPDPDQPRTETDPAAQSRLTESVREYGILQPISVREIGDGEFTIVGGHRRLQAAEEVGLTEMPCLIMNFDRGNGLSSSVRARQLTENFAREDLSPLDKAMALADLKRELGGEKKSWDKIENSLGISETSRKEYLRLLKLPAPIQDKIREFLFSKKPIGSDDALTRARELRDNTAENRAAKKESGPDEWTVTFNSPEELIEKLEKKLRELKADEAKPRIKKANKPRTAGAKEPAEQMNQSRKKPS